MAIPPLLIILLFGAFIIVALYMLYLNISKKEKKTIRSMLPIFAWAFVIVLIVMILLWNLGPAPPKNRNLCTGFAKIRCIDPSIIFDSKTYTLNATFINGVGDRVTITDVKVSGDCTTGSFEKTEVAAGYITKFSCTGSRKEKGDSFSVDVEIIYTQKVGSATITHTDIGRITGKVE